MKSRARGPGSCVAIASRGMRVQPRSRRAVRIVSVSLPIEPDGLGHRLVRLEKAGLIRREPSPDDGRSMLVALTETGIALAEKAFRKDMANEAQFLEPLSAKERDMLAGLLRKLIAGIESRAALPDG